MPIPKFCSWLTVPENAEEDDINSFSDFRRVPLELLRSHELEADRPIHNYVSGQYLRRVIATENKKMRSKI